MRIEKDLIRGGAALAILKVISEGETYGYEIVEKLSARSENVFRLSEGTLYPILHAMVKERYLDTYEKTAPGMRRVRRYYRITAAGELHLGYLEACWREFSKGMEGVLAEAQK